jgi:hypothetical protein
MDGRQVGDPCRAASAILQVAALDQPPLRVVLGVDAVRAYEQRIASDTSLLETWRDLAVSTNYR